VLNLHFRRRGGVVIRPKDPDQKNHILATASLNVDLAMKQQIPHITTFDLNNIFLTSKFKLLRQIMG
jgi:hypothetical protein